MDKDKVIQKQDEIIDALSAYSTHVVIMWNKDNDDDESKDLKVRLWENVKKLKSELSALKSAKEEARTPYQVDAISQIVHAWAFLRQNNQSIPDDILDLMKDSAIASITGASQFQYHQLKEEVKSAEEILTNFLDCEGFNIPEEAIPIIVKAVHEFHFQFQSVQPWGESLNTDKRVITTDNPDQFQKFSLLEENETITSSDTIPDQSVQSNEEKPEVRKEISRMLNIAFNEGFNQTKSKEFDKWCKYAVNFIFGLINPPANPVQSVKGEGERRKEIEDLMAVVWENAIKCYVEDKPGVKGFLINSGQLETDGSSTEPKSMTVKDVIDTIMQMIGDKHSESKEWISVKDRLPEKMERVLCYNGFRVIDQSWCSHTNHDIDWFKKEFTHWMPLPEPPKK